MSLTDPPFAELPLERSPTVPILDAWYLTGPTAAGKTAVGIELAEQLGAEIISLDSMALFEGMDIGTAKPSAADRTRVPHHLLDIVLPSADFSLSDYLDAAHRAVAEIRSRGRQPLFVGGTPLYLKSLLRGVFQGPPADWQFREQIERELVQLPLESLHQRLQVIDPLLALKLHPHDKRRIIRGLEVYRLTGQRLSHLQTQFDEANPPSATRVFVLTWPREVLHRRIDERVEQMFAAGLVDEVQRLLAKYGALSRTALQAVGYREVVEMLGTPGGSLVDCIARVKARTRQFARRQETWFRSLAECRPFQLTDDLSPAAVAEQIARLGSETSLGSHELSSRSAT
jgi:tRNA dimethylallyltransferase